MEQTVTEKGPSCEPKKLNVVKKEKREHSHHYIPPHHDADALNVTCVELLGVFLLLAPVRGLEVAPGYEEQLLGDFWTDFDSRGRLGIKVVFI